MSTQVRFQCKLLTSQVQHSDPVMRSDLPSRCFFALQLPERKVELSRNIHINTPLLQIELGSVNIISSTLRIPGSHGARIWHIWNQFKGSFVIQERQGRGLSQDSLYGLRGRMPMSMYTNSRESTIRGDLRLALIGWSSVIIPDPSVKHDCRVQPRYQTERQMPPLGQLLRCGILKLGTVSRLAFAESEGPTIDYFSIAFVLVVIESKFLSKTVRLSRPFYGRIE